MFYSHSVFVINHFVLIAAPLAGRGSAGSLCLLAASPRYVPGLPNCEAPSRSSPTTAGAQVQRGAGLGGIRAPSVGS